MEKKKTYVGQSVVKRDAMALMTGKPVYTDDIAPKDCLIVKVLRSPHAHAWIEEIDKTRALSVPGIETILTWEDSPQKRFTMAGQTYPEPSPYDRLILDRRMRFVLRLTPDERVVMIFGGCNNGNCNRTWRSSL